MDNAPDGSLIIEPNSEMVLRDGKKKFRTGLTVDTLLAMMVGHSRAIGRRGRGYLVVRWQRVVDIWHGETLFVFLLRDIRGAIRRRTAVRKKKR